MQLVPVKVSEIACFYAEDKEVFLLTLDNERFIIPHSIKELSEKLGPKQFFRVNLQFIISSEAIHNVHNYFKLNVEIKADPKMEIIVSRARATAFKAWMNGNRSEYFP